jgi:hypothetical protein
VLLFEDADIVFSDEEDFYPSLIKLFNMTKVPIIITASNKHIINQHLVTMMKENEVEYGEIDYEYEVQS